MMFKRHYEYHESEDKDLQKEKKACHWCQLRKFSTFEDYPVAIINEVDDSTLPQDFVFIERSILRRGVKAAEPEFRAGCECEDDRECQRSGCHCLQDMKIADPKQDQKIYVYHSRGTKKECLRSEMLTSGDPIYECHNACACSEDCSNRVVESGRKIPLQVFMTGDGRGWGVKCPVGLKKGQYIDNYFGEIITAKEADKRRNASDVAKRKDVYLFALDKFSDKKSMDPRLAGRAFEVDGEFLSGPTRFINHSCNPNLRIFARVGDHADKHIHDLAFFALEDINAGDELTFDYVDGSDGGDGADNMGLDSQDPAKQKDMTECLCGADNCRGFLW